MNEDYLIDYLRQYNNVKEDLSYWNKDQQIRALMNITMPYDLSKEFYTKQDEYLQGLLKTKRVTDVLGLPFHNQIAVYRGDITLLKADAIMNACNSQMLGCFVPLHGCIDNAIHSAAGLEVRRDLLQVMKKQGKEEPNGQVKVTLGYNLPSKYIFHTVGPIVEGGFVTSGNRKDLENCYLSCLRKADAMGLKTLIFCSISTGIYGYPIKKAAEVAVKTTEKYMQETGSELLIVFDVFSERDEEIYENELRRD